MTRDEVLALLPVLGGHHRWRVAPFGDYWLAAHPDSVPLTIDDATGEIVPVSFEPVAPRKSEPFTCEYRLHAPAKPRP